VCGIQNLAPCSDSFLMQKPAPAHHAFVRKLWLEPVLSQAPAPRGVIAFDAENPRALNRKRSERLSNEGNAHLSFEQNGMTSRNDGRNSFQPFESHASLPGSTRLIAGFKCGHDLRGRYPDCVKTENRDRGMIHFDCSG